MATVKIEVGHNWVEVAPGGRQVTVECVNGTGVLWVSEQAPLAEEFLGHVITSGRAFMVNEKTWARCPGGDKKIIIIAS